MVSSVLYGNPLSYHLSQDSAQPVLGAGHHRHHRAVAPQIPLLEPDLHPPIDGGALVAVAVTVAVVAAAVTKQTRRTKSELSTATSRLRMLLLWLFSLLF